MRLLPILGGGATHSTLFQGIPSQEYEGIFQVVNSSTEADIMLFPHNYKSARAENADYVKKIVQESLLAKKKLMIIAYGDSTDEIDLSNVIILRSSKYRSQMRPYEIMMPAYVEDIGRVHHEPLSKSAKPKVGFVGKAGFANSKELFKYLIKTLCNRGAEKPGEWFRRSAIHQLQKSVDIDLRTIIRKMYSGSQKTIEISPEEARRTYIENMQNTHFTLAPRGYGNFSMRFYETLAMGRIPVLIDTDMRLPLEDRIPYDKFIVRVPCDKMKLLSRYVLDFYNRHDEESWINAQKQARQYFENYLYMPAFLRIVFTHEYLDSYIKA